MTVMAGHSGPSAYGWVAKARGKRPYIPLPPFNGWGSGPCADPLHFEIVDGMLSPQEWMQHRHVATAQQSASTKTFPVIGGDNKDTVIHSLAASWTNDSPIPQWVYGLVTRGGVRVTLQAASRAYILTSHGVGGSGNLSEVSKVGCGMELGKEGLFANDAFGIIEVRQHASTVPLDPQSCGWTAVDPGETFEAEVEVKFVSDNWQSATIDGGTMSAESSYSIGGTRIDLYAIPVIAGY